jgi:hypothetical protein
MAFLFKALFGGGNQQPQQAQSAQVAQQAQAVKHGAVEIILNPEANQIVFNVAEKKDYKPIAFDLNTGYIINAQFPPEPAPPPSTGGPA